MDQVFRVEVLEGKTTSTSASAASAGTQTSGNRNESGGSLTVEGERPAVTIVPPSISVSSSNTCVMSSPAVPVQYVPLVNHTPQTFVVPMPVTGTPVHQVRYITGY